MRVTNGMIANNLMRNLGRNLGRMEKIQQQLYSGKKFVRPSDDPIGVSRSLRLNTEVATMDQYKRNADDIQSWLSTTEQAINNINDILKRAKELTTQGVNETNSLAEREAIAEEIKELRNQLLQIGNSTYAGSYIFSGYKTDKPLFNIADGTYDLGGGTSSLTLDEVIAVNVGIKDRMGINTVGQRLFGYYSGSGSTGLDITTAESIKLKQTIAGNQPITYPVGSGSFKLTYEGTEVTLNLAADYGNAADLVNAINSEITNSTVLNTHVTASVVDNKLVFESDGKLLAASDTLDVNSLGLTNNQVSVQTVEPGDSSQLIAVFDQLVADLKADDTGAIRSAMTRLEKHSANVNTIWAEIGVKTNRVELTTNRIEDNTLNLKGLLSKNEDADMSEVIINLQMQTNVYNASLAGGAKIIQPSLIDFLR